MLRHRRARRLPADQVHHRSDNLNLVNDPEKIPQYSRAFCEGPGFMCSQKYLLFSIPVSHFSTNDATLMASRHLFLGRFHGD
jgi:hypothetical protein